MTTFLRSILAGCAASLLVCSVAAAKDKGGPEGYTVTGPIKKLANDGRPLKKVPFPKIADWGTLRIKLQRTACFGTCAAYLVEIDDSGTVRYEGEMYVAIPGKHTSHISRDAVRNLYEAFEKADFFWTRDEYRASVTDLPTYALSISFDGHSKQVIDYAGQAIGMPKAVRELEDAVDTIAKTGVWVEGNAQSIKTLQDEGWNFRANTADNLRMLEGAAQKDNAPLVKNLLAAGVNAKTKFGCRGAEAAARYGNAEIVIALLGAGAPVHWDDKQSYDCDVLSAAASSGHVKTMQVVLDRRPNVNWQDSNGGTALMRAAEGTVSTTGAGRDYSAVTKLLLAAGANVNIRDHDGKSAIMMVSSSAKVVRALMAAGAEDINRRYGPSDDTPLMTNYDADVAEAMLENGANPWLINKKGRNAQEQVSYIYGTDNAAAKVIKKWMATHREAK